MFAEARDIISKVDNGLTWVPSLEKKTCRGTFVETLFELSLKQGVL